MVSPRHFCMLPMTYEAPSVSKQLLAQQATACADTLGDVAASPLAIKFVYT